MGAEDKTRHEEIVSVFIPRIRRKQSHVEYVIEVTGKSAVWNIYRRYQQFRDLHGALSRLCSLTDNYHTPKGVLPVIPGTSWIRVTSDDVDLVEKRRLHLEIYLQQLMVPSNKFYRDCIEVRQFMHQDEMPVNYKNALSRTVPGINAPLETEPSGSVERIFDEDTEEDRRHHAVIASRPASAVESAIAPEIPKMDDWSTGSRQHNEINAIASGFVAQPSFRSNDAKEALVQQADKEAGRDESTACLVPYELCKACGHREDIDFDLEEWVSSGTCRNCGQLTEHELVDPTTAKPPAKSGGGVGRGEGDDEEEEDEGDTGGGARSPGGSASAVEVNPQELARRRAEAAGVPHMDTLTDSQNPSNSPSSRGSSNKDGAGASASSAQRSRSPNADGASPAAGAEEAIAPKDEQLAQATQSFDARCDISLADFDLITTLGRGTFGKVMKARYKGDGKLYAIKVLSKSMVHQKRMVDYVKEEKSIMAFLPPHPFVVQLHFAFQTDHHLYFVMDFLTGGELYAHMQPLERLPLHAARFYAAELLLAIEHTHKYDVCHRDLKPENIVLSADGHIKLTDFGLARQRFTQKRRFSFVGSAEYLSPEVVRTEGQSKAIDWWGFGCMVYEFLTGRTPFHAHTAREVYAAILNRQVDFNKPGMTPEAQDFITRILDKNPRTRLQDPNKMKRHPFFAGINWEHVFQKKMKPPFVPDLKSNDTKYFSKEFTSEWATIPAPANSTRASIERLATRFSNFRRIGDHHIPVPQAGGMMQRGESGLSPRTEAGGGGGTKSPRDGAAAAAAGGTGGGPTTPSPRMATTASVASTTNQSIVTSPSKAVVLYGRPLPTAEAIHPLISLPQPELEVSAAIANLRASGMPPGPIEFKHVDPEDFVGVWRLLNVEMVSTLGQIVFPWGAEVAGQLIFTSNGLYSIQICPIKRLRFRGISKPTREEMCEAFGTYVASFGNFFVVPGKPFVVQRATAALSPSLMGVLQKRYFDVDVDKKLLKLMTPLYKGEGNALVFSSMTWSKVA